MFPWNPEAIDFSKCVGKVVKANGDQEKRQAKNTITFEKFKEIAGNTLLKKFENFDSLHETNEVNVLYKLWLEFCIPIQKEEESAIESDIEIEVVDNIDNIKVDRKEEPPENEWLTFTNSIKEDIQPLKCSLEWSTTNPKTESLIELPNKNIDNIINIFDGRPLNNFSKLNHEPLVPDENINILNVEFVLEENGKLIEIPEFSKQVVEIKGNTLDQHLYWPKTPERKGVKTLREFLLLYLLPRGNK